MTAADLAEIDLTDDERCLLLAGLMEYGGPAAGAGALAPLVGAKSVDVFFELTGRLSEHFPRSGPCSASS